MGLTSHPHRHHTYLKIQKPNNNKKERELNHIGSVMIPYMVITTITFDI